MWRRVRYVLVLVVLCSLATCPVARRRWRLEERAREAPELLAVLADRVEAVWKERGRLPQEPAGPTPRLGLCCDEGGECPVDAGQWQRHGWAALGFTIDDPHRYSYQYQPVDGGRAAVIRAIRRPRLRRHPRDLPGPPRSRRRPPPAHDDGHRPLPVSARRARARSARAASARRALTLAVIATSRHQSDRLRRDDTPARLAPAPGGEYATPMTRLGTILLALALVAGCGKKKSNENAQPAPAAGSAEAGSAAEAVPTGPSPAVEARQMFKTVCSTCHGADGRGDGPGAAALNPKPRDYTDKKWQASVTDQHIKDTILKGGAAMGLSPAMPAQPQLKSKPEVVDQLVRIIRTFGK